MMDLTQLHRQPSTMNLHLRALAIGDSDSMHELMSDTETVKYWTNAPIYDVQKSHEKLLEDLDSDGEWKDSVMLRLLKSS